LILREPNIDLALIQILSPREIGHAAHLMTSREFDQVNLYEPVYVCGCSLGDPPAITNGNLSQITLTDFLVSAWAIFGNSGGGAFTADGKLLGIVYNIDGVPLLDGRVIPEPNRTRVIPGPLIHDWLKYNAIEFNMSNYRTVDFGTFFK